MFLYCPSRSSKPFQSEIFSLCSYEQGQSQWSSSNLREYFTLGWFACPGRPIHTYEQRENELLDTVFKANTSREQAKKHDFSLYIYRRIEQKDTWKRQTQILPYHSDITTRQEIAAADKELCRQRKWKEDIDFQNYRTQIKAKLWKLQLKQLVSPLSPTFIHFLQCLINLDTENRKYFLQFLNLGLNERSVQHLEPLYQKYSKYHVEGDSEGKEERLQKKEEEINHGSLSPGDGGDERQHCCTRKTSKM